MRAVEQTPFLRSTCSALFALLDSLTPDNSSSPYLTAPDNSSSPYLTARLTDLTTWRAHFKPDSGELYPASFHRPEPLLGLLYILSPRRTREARVVFERGDNTDGQSSHDALRSLPIAANCWSVDDALDPATQWCYLMPGVDARCWCQ